MLVSLKVSFSKNNYHPIIRLQNTITFFTSKNLCFKESCDHIQGFQWLQLVIIEGYETILGCHMHWSSQNGLEVVLEPQRACTILPGTHCITKIKNLLGVVGVLPSLFFLTGITVLIQGDLLDGTDSLDLDSSGKLSNMLWSSCLHKCQKHVILGGIQGQF